MGARGAIFLGHGKLSVHYKRASEKKLRAELARTSAAGRRLLGENVSAVANGGSALLRRKRLRPLHVTRTCGVLQYNAPARGQRAAVAQNEGISPKGAPTSNV